MFGDSTTVADVRQLLDRRAASVSSSSSSSPAGESSSAVSALLVGGLEQFEAAVLNSFRCLMAGEVRGSDRGGGGGGEGGGGMMADFQAAGGDDSATGREIASSDSDTMEVMPVPAGAGTGAPAGTDRRTGDRRDLTGEGPGADGEAAGPTMIACQCECQREDELNLMELPVQVLLHIFSYLGAADLASVGGTCRQGYSLCSDQLLWRDVLAKDQLAWSRVGHRSHPAFYKMTASDMTYKEIYMRCSPNIQQQAAGFNLYKLPQLLWSFMPHRPPKVVMFGPGLESNSSTLVRKFLGSGSDLFKVRGVFPAVLPGVGTGFRVLSSDGKVDMRLITMYSGTKRDREEQAGIGCRAQRNLLLQVAPESRGPPGVALGSAGPPGVSPDPRGEGDGSREEAAGGAVYEPKPTIQELCRNVDAFLFVVDASAGPEARKMAIESRPELFALMDGRWTASRCPLVILSCIPKRDTPRVPCVTLAKELNLHRLDRTWKMFDATVTDMSGVLEAVTWLVESTQGR